MLKRGFPTSREWSGIVGKGRERSGKVGKGRERSGKVGNFHGGGPNNTKIDD